MKFSWKTCDCKQLDRVGVFEQPKVQNRRASSASLEMAGIYSSVTAPGSPFH